MPPAPETPIAALREHLYADAGVREASVSRFWLVFLSVSILLLLNARGRLGEMADWHLALLGVMVLFELAVLWIARSGRGFRALPWLCVLLEVSMPGALLYQSLSFRHPTEVLSSPVLLLWGMPLMLSALRMMPALCLVAGACSAVELLALYFWRILPTLPETTISQLEPPAIVARAVFLFFMGVAAAMVARHLIRKAEEALHAVRARDLMSKYFLHEQLGAGGMAEVYRATYCPEGGFEKTVAVKRVLPSLSSSPRLLEMLREEAQLCALLNHPNLVQVLDCGLYQGAFILAMEYVDGVSLARLLEVTPAPLPLSAVCSLGAELAAALDYIHRRKDGAGAPIGLVHRDVNPANILVERVGEAKLGDFGVATATGRASAAREGVFYGKVLYAAPEQLAGHAVDGRADLYALGLTLHEALTSRRVLNREEDARREEGAARIPPPSALRPDVPTALDALVMRLLEVEPSKRPATGAEVRAELLALSTSLAPHGAGQAELAQLVERALQQARPASGEKRAVSNAAAPTVPLRPARAP